MNEELLQLLRAARPSGQDEHEAGVAAARAAAAQEADVLEQLAEEQRTDLAMQAALQNVEPPPDLESAMLTAMRAARGAVEPPPALRDSVLTAVQRPPARTNLTRRTWLGWSTAAAAALAAGGVWWWRRTHAFTMQRLSEELAAITKAGVTLSLMSMDKTAVAAWLRDNAAPRAAAFPDKLDALPRKGCHLYDVAGHPVSLECLLLPEMRELHLFTTPSAELDDPPADGAAAEVRDFAGRSLATWSRGGFTMLLFSEQPADTIRPLLA
jgi:hypothetical protein